jgi:hypothetical protein
MEPSALYNKLGQKDADIETITSTVLKDKALIPPLINGLSTAKGRIRFGCEKVLRAVSEVKPEWIYPYFDVYVRLLDSENSFLKWGAIIVIANLARADRKHQFEPIFQKYFAPIAGPELVTAANTVGHAWKIGLAKPTLIPQIVTAILKVEQTSFLHQGQISPECTNIACGQAINTFDHLFKQLKDPTRVIAFVKRQLHNNRPAVRKRAQQFVQKYEVPE